MRPHLTCAIYGDPHYFTFDGNRLDLQGVCSYTVVETCTRKVVVLDSGLETTTVLANVTGNETNSNTTVVVPDITDSETVSNLNFSVIIKQHRSATSLGGFLSTIEFVEITIDSEIYVLHRNWAFTVSFSI